MACLLTVVCVLGLGAGMLSTAYAEEPVAGSSGESTGTIVSAVPYTPVDPPANLDKPCELTVYPCGSSASFKTDVESAVMTLDLYLIAKAAAIPGIDSYDYELENPFSGLAAELEKARKYEENVGKDEWYTLAQQAAVIIRNAASGSVAPYLTVTKAAGAPCTVIAGTESAPFLPGLYLLVPHTDASDYWKEQKETTDPLLSITYSDSYFYYYEPQLISMPHKRESIPTIPTTTEPVMTSDPGGWYYGLNVYMKPQQEPRHADLWIEKNLHNYYVNSNAIFVFHVDAVRNNETVYSKAFSILFNGNEPLSGNDGVTKYTVAKDVPLGATVKVTETYDGSSCVPDSQTVFEGVMTKDGLKINSTTTLQPVPFKNMGKGPNGGGGIENTYTYQESQAGGSSGSWNGSKNMAPGQSSMPDVSVQSGTGS